MVIGIYARKSVYRDNSDSVQVQIKSCKDYAKIIYPDTEIEFMVYDQDEGFSGKNTNRPAFQRLLSDVRNNRLDVVMVYKLDRISRSVKDFSDTYELLQAHHTAFLSVKETFDTSTPIGRTVMYILAAFAQLERENTSERVSDSMMALGSTGKWTGGTLPFGMTSIRKIAGDKEHSFLIVDNERIGVVKTIYELYLSGRSISGIERYFRDNGIRTETGKFFSTSKLHSILSNPVYCSNDLEAYYYFQEKGYCLPEKEQFDGTRGLIGYGRTKQSSKMAKTETWAISVGIHKPVIPAAEWIKCQERFGQNKMFRDNKYEIGILKGILRCQCGARIDVRTYHKNGRLFSYYYCSKMHRQGKSACATGYVKVQQIDDLFIQKLREIKLNPECITLKTEAVYVNTDKIRTDLKKTTESIRNLTKALMENSESAAASYIIEQIEKLDKEKKLLEKKLIAAEQNNRDAATAAETREFVYQNICRLLDNFDGMTYKEKNELLKNTVTSCILKENGLQITF